MPQLRRYSLWIALAAILSCGFQSFAQTTSPAVGPVTGEAEALSLLNLNLPGMESVKAAAATGDLAAVKQAYLDYRRTKSTARLTRDYPPPAATGGIDEVAEEICRHVIRNTYNFDPRTADMGADFNWKLNPISKDSPAFTMEWTWCAVSRTHFWATLTEAYTKTGNEKYAREWVAQLLDFAAKNPVNEKLRPGQASLWRTLDSAIRVQYTWAPSYFRCLGSSAFTPEAQWTYLRLMNDHAQLLCDGLKPANRTGNWVTTECSALFAIGTLFPEFKDSDQWRKIAVDRLLVEANHAVPPDGFEAELTPNYHFVTLNGFITPVELARRNNITLPPEFEAKMLAMYRAAVLVMDQSGNMPPVNDSGIINAVKRAQQGVQLLGNDPLLLWASTGGKEGTAPPLSTMLPYAGFYVMRSGWQRNDTYLFFRGGPAGIGHEHEDMLSIILRAGDKTLLFDPGTYSYDQSDWRRYTINTPSHNTIIVDGKWQHRGPNKPPVTEPVRNPWVTTPLFDYVSATYDQGYQLNEYDPKRQYTPQRWVGDIDRSVTHTRHVLFLKPRTVLVLDFLTGTGEHTFDAHFHIDSPSAKQDAATQSVTSQNTSGTQLSLYPLDRDHLTTDIIVGQQNPILGWFPGGSDRDRRPVPTVRFRKQQPAPATFATLLIPHESAAPAVTATAIKTENGNLWGQQIKTSDAAITILLAKDQKTDTLATDSPGLGRISAKAAGILAVQNAVGQQTNIGLIAASELTSPGLQLASTSPISLQILQQGANLYLFNGSHNDASIQITRPWPLSVSLPAGKWIQVTPNGAQPLANNITPELNPSKQ